MDLGIIGRARAGKTTLFNAVTRGTARVGEYSARDEPNVGVVRVPDPRVDALARIFKPKKITYAEIRWVDYPVAGFEAAGPGQRLLAELAGMDALVHVARAFEDDAVPHPDGSVDLDRDIESLDLELAFADLALIERRFERIDAEMRSIKASERGRIERDRALLERVRAALEAGTHVHAIELSETERRELAGYQFVTRPPQLLVVNVGEDQLAEAEALRARYSERYAGRGRAAAVLCARLEAELATLDEAEAAEFRADLGLEREFLLDRTIQIAYELLGVCSFLTVGEDECRAWTVRAGATAPEAAGAIHSDLQRGFIRAEVARWDELVDAGSLAELRKRGRLRTEGRDYVVQDGDVLNILFNV